MNSKYFKIATILSVTFGLLVVVGNGCGQNFSATSKQNAERSSGELVVDPILLPSVEIVTGPANPNSLAKQSFTFSSDDASATFECKLDNYNFVACANPYEISKNSLANGQHQLVVRAKRSDGSLSLVTSPYIWNIEDPVTPVMPASVIETAINTGKCTARPNNQILCADIVYDILQPANRAADLKLDLYLQKNPIGKSFPLIIYIHGGGWLLGNRKDRCQDGVLSFVSKGYAVACISYRRTSNLENAPGENLPKAIFPAQIKDVRTAVQFLRKNVGTTLNPNRFGAWGTSAGGHLAALLGTSANDPTLEGRGESTISSRVQAVINYSGPTNLDFFVTGPQKTSVAFPEAFVGGPVGKSPSVLTEPAKDNIIMQIDPATWADESDPPMLIVHSKNDETVPVISSQYLHQKLQEAGVDSTYIERPGSGHSFVPVHVPQLAEQFLEDNL